jgi:hypothetical protein
MKLTNRHHEAIQMMILELVEPFVVLRCQRCTTASSVEKFKK